MQKSKGFTLLELMVTLTIFLVLVSVGLPQMSSWISANQMDSRVSSIAGMLRSARSEALTRNNTVTLATGGNSQDWANSITMYTDTSGGNNPFNSAEGDVEIRIIDLTTDQVTINGNTVAGEYISFSSNGRLDGTGDAIIEVCNGSNTQGGQTISVNIVGRVSISEGVTDCTP